MAHIRKTYRRYRKSSRSLSRWELIPSKSFSVMTWAWQTTLSHYHGKASLELPKHAVSAAFRCRMQPCNSSGSSGYPIMLNQPVASPSSGAVSGYLSCGWRVGSGRMMQSLTRPERNRNTKQHTNDLQLWPPNRVEGALAPGLQSQYLIVWVGIQCLKG